MPNVTSDQGWRINAEQRIEECGRVKIFKNKREPLGGEYEADKSCNREDDLSCPLSNYNSCSGLQL